MNAERRRGRRVAERRGPRAETSAVGALAVLLVAALAVVLTRNPEPSPLTGPDAGALVDRTVAACPDFSGTPALRSSTDVGLAPVQGPTGAVGDRGSLSVGPASGAAESSLRRGALESGPGTSAAVLEARGEKAAGVFGFRTDRIGRTSAVAACVAPRAGWWFTGAGAGLDHLSELVMTNVDPGPAVVDIAFFGEDGELETLDTRGVVIAPGETKRIALADVVPQNDEVVVQVQASRGRVAAAVLDRFAPEVAGPSGLEWLTGPDEPQRLVRLAGIPATATRRTLLVGNPSELEALVDLEVSGARGSFVPTGFETVSVPPGAVRAVDITGLFTGNEATSVRLRSRVPVVATIRSVRGADTSYAATVVPLDDPAAVPVPTGVQTTVQLSAGPGGATAHVAGYSRRGEPTGEDDLTIDPSATVAWKPGRGTAYVVVTPVTGKVTGAATSAGRTGTAAVPLVALPVRLELPGVVPAPR